MFEFVLNNHLHEETSVVYKNDFNFVDMFKNFPIEILKAQVKQLEAIFQLISGNFHTAAEILIEIIEQKKYYSPKLQRYCLNVLINIFKLFDIPTLPIQNF